MRQSPQRQSLFTDSMRDMGKAGLSPDNAVFHRKPPRNRPGTVSFSLNNPAETAGLRATKQQVNVTFWPKLNETTQERQARGVLLFCVESWK
ncbi:hypothetical protein [Yoonia vestfoldensis]|uniref:hypothetical protein n=1 Tax=Yoonia vestfoldensis TaxID=245188 RepID=UPI0012FF5C93|nr:hypothetical protein [Yoonia vestfoldensis]